MILDREELEFVLGDHYYDANWPRTHQGSRCGCGWIGEDHVAHVADQVLGLLVSPEVPS